MNQPDGVSWSRKIFDVMPKLLSMGALFHTVGYVPSYFAETQFGDTQAGGRLIPTVMVSGSLWYTLRLTMRLPAWKCPSATANPPKLPARAANETTKTTFCQSAREGVNFKIVPPRKSA